MWALELGSFVSHESFGIGVWAEDCMEDLNVTSVGFERLSHV